jgi:hypothetical protein
MTKLTPKFQRDGTNGALLVLIVDESGSMRAVHKDTLGGLNSTVETFKKNNADSRLTFVKFDAPFGKSEVTTVFNNMPIAEVPTITEEHYNPRSGTNLYDAIGRTLVQINNTLLVTAPSMRPTVTVCIMTDGEENSSREYTSEDIKKMVSAAEEVGNWTFMFLGANINAFAEGAKFGMRSVNTMEYDMSSIGVTFDAVGASMLRTATAKMGGATTEQLYGQLGVIFTDAERNQVKGKK